MITSGLLSSNTDEWYTPLDLFNALDDEFHFDLDPCATDENHKCDLYFTKKENGLIQDWGGHNVFCNPPYGKVIGDWIKKSFIESHKPNTLVVMLLPARTDTSWFHDYILDKAEVRFIRGRLAFSGVGSAPFPSMVVIYDSVHGEKPKEIKRLF